jgi:hypothetical protein
MTLVSMDQHIRSDLRYSLIDGLAYSLMVGLGESFIAAFVLARGHGEVSASLISTAPLFVGAILQLAAPAGIAFLGSFRAWVLLVASLQTVSLLALATFTFTDLGYGIIFLICTVFWGAGLAAGPAWNAWVAQLIPARVRTGFFATRSRWCHLFTFFGLMGGGFILQTFENRHAPMIGFMIVFSTAAIFRLVSIKALALQSHPKALTVSPEIPSLRSMNRMFRQSSLRSFMIFMLLVHSGANICSSLFTPFWLKHLSLSYSTYMALLACALVSRFVALAYARPLIERWGLRNICLASLALIAPLPLFFTWTDHLPMFFLFQVASGIGWGFFELVTFLTLFNELPGRDRSSLLTYFNLLQTSGIVLGAIVGATLFKVFGSGWMGYEVVFSVSAFCRLAACAGLPGMPWHLVRLRTWIELRPISVRAHAGLLARPILVRIPFPRRRQPKPSHPKESGPTSK